MTTMTTHTSPEISATLDALRGLVEKELASLTEIRRDLHAHPELMFEESRTSGVVTRELDTLGIAYKAGLAKGTGVVAHLPATVPNAADTIALRADMDALPIREETGKPYASTTPGVMHACGHDGHVTILLGAARVLSKLDHRPHGITLVFQPAEEGGAGGDHMCKDGALKGDKGGGVGTPVSRIYGLHGWPNMPLNTVGTRAGPLLAATDEFHITVKGVGGHAAYPHLAKDPIVAASAVVGALQTICSRSASPLDSVVCTVGKIAGGSANNVIPVSVELVGTVRTLRDDTRAMAKQRLFEIAELTAKAHGCTAHIDWEEGYPVTTNDPTLADRMHRLATEAFGEDRVIPVPEPSMGGEDFSYYGRQVPACFYLLGLRPEGANPATVPQLHQAGFDFNDQALGTGVEMMCRLALGG